MIKRLEGKNDMGDQSKQELLHTPEGLWDHYGADYAQYRTVTQMIGETMHRYGYEDIKTPTFEFFDVFSVKSVPLLPGSCINSLTRTEIRWCCGRILRPR